MVSPASISADNGINLRSPMKGSIFMSEPLCLSAASAPPVGNNEAPGRALHLGASRPDGDTHTALLTLVLLDVTLRVAGIDGH